MVNEFANGRDSNIRYSISSTFRNNYNTITVGPATTTIG